MNRWIEEHAKQLSKPTKLGSYSQEDCVFLLKNISTSLEEMSSAQREQAIQQGVHYSETLPSEQLPTDQYMRLFHDVLTETAEPIARYIGIVAEMILKERGKEVILVSLVRAGTPVGVLIKRYIKEKYQLDVPHYSISIIRGKGIDENALCHIIHQHQSANLQFVDGWTGKGVINDVLKKACIAFEQRYHVSISPDLAVLADPSHSVRLFGTREDFLIPSACLNSTISGLTSRSVLREDLIGPYDFHGVKYYENWQSHDVSNMFVDHITSYFPSLSINSEKLKGNEEILNLGMKEVQEIKETFDIEDINRVKPGVGETTRVLLRRVPWKILVKSKSDPRLKHVIALAKEKQVPIEEYPYMSYTCCGLIKNVKGDVQ